MSVEIVIQNDWAEKYRPKTFKDLIGNKKAIHELRLWAEEWEKGVPEKKAVILYGTAGIGKTSSAAVLAAEMGWEYVEMNAGDQRTADVIERIAGMASKTTTLFSHEVDEDGKKSSGRRLIVLDEADNLHGTYDKGGSKAIADVIDKTTQPILLIANDVYGITQTIRSKSMEIEFSRIQTRSLVPVLTKICQNEGITAAESAILKIAENAGGDVRSAINDLQAVTVGKTEIADEDIVISGRDVKETIFKALVKVFKGHHRSDALDAVKTLDETPEDLILWVDENLPIQFPNQSSDGKSANGINPDVANGYQVLSKADLYLGRVRRRQTYRMWRYAGFMTTVGPMSVRSKDYSGFIKYTSPSKWKRMGQSRSVRNMRDNIAVKISARHGKSMRVSRNEIIPYYRKLMENEEYAIALAGESDFDMDELVYLLKAKSATKKVQSVYEKSRFIADAKRPAEPEFFKTPESEKRSTVAAADKNQLTLEEITKKSEEKKAEEEQAAAKTEEKPKNQKSLFDF
ncbi:replication factor C large subunit [Methanimicrococcus blatticola]|uniref:Replication factor C large subunit n=1 Tax=Methanimicrococcus blatticola TaxID=91560 RepID=A0A484F5B9_9EURY|nr:replication factor C large subunit [Methanimicrococcus blatticola]MCC2509013.1 replication factor C large subunit [Methanimicrococcus blatticola]TDQ70960.1 replication factor C large subunit [Methanimicrococcus blatticola]